MPTSCFNGATAFRQWKPRSAQRPRGMFKCFNGATAFRQWKPAKLLEMLDPVANSFNGATAFRQWEHYSQERWGYIKRNLQWGHRLSAVETEIGATAKGDVQMLQWGHRLSAVETIIKHHWYLNHCSLQWGHRLSAVETWHSAKPTRHPGGRFNGATAFRQWKRNSAFICTRPGYPASMGPPPFGSGNLDRVCPPVALCRGFNGATAFRQWKRVATRSEER